MKQLFVWIGLSVFAIALGAPDASQAAFTESHVLNRNQAFSLCAAGTCFSADHTWAESHGDASCPNDMVQSRNGNDKPSVYCQNRVNNTGCSKARESANFNHVWTNSTSSCSQIGPLYGNCYANANIGAYAVNGVCHQATNRAFARTFVPWMSDISWIAGGWESTALFFNYGTTAPLIGVELSQGC